MTDTRQVIGVVQSVTEATSVNGTFWKVALPPSRPGLKYPEVYNINKPEWMEGVKAGVTIALDVKRGRPKKPEPQYDNDYYWDVQGVKVLSIGGPSDTDQAGPWPGTPVPTPAPPAEAPTAVPQLTKQPIAPPPAGNSHPKLGSEKLTPRERAMTLAIESYKGQTVGDIDLTARAEIILKWLEG